jgi:hypothetical protein
MAAATTNARVADTLFAIPPLGTDVSNEARAITPDGVNVVGLSGTESGFLYNITNAYLVQPTDPYLFSAKILTGVCYRTDTNPPAPPEGTPQLVVSGLVTNGTVKYFTMWMTPDSGTNWDYSFGYVSGKIPTPPLANGLAGSSWDVFHATWTDQGNAAGDNWTLYVHECNGYWGPNVNTDVKGVPKPNSFTQMNGISGKGRAVGWRRNSGAYVNYIADYNGPSTSGSIWNCNGLDGTTSGQATAVNDDGTVILGISPKGAPTGTTNFGYKATFNTTFPGAATELSIGQLPDFADSVGVSNALTGVANTAIAFGCTPDGKCVVGMSYRGREKAVYWDTSDANSSNWKVIDLTEAATTAGIMGDFTNLSRAYSIGTNAAGQKVVAGIGQDSTNNTRAFVLSFTPSFAPTPTRVTSFNIAKGPGSNLTLSYSGGTGSRFVLVQSSSITAPLSGWARVKTNTSTPGSFTITPGSDPREFYKIKSE